MEINMSRPQPSTKIKLRRRTYRLEAQDTLPYDLVPDVVEDQPDDLNALGIEFPRHSRVEEDSQACDAFWCQLGVNTSISGINA